MANELAYDKGIAVTLDYEVANIAADAVAALTFGGQLGNGFLVPTGYAFHPIYLSGDSNADFTAGTLTFQATDDGTVIVGGPQPVLADTVQRQAAVARVGVRPIPAGHFVGVKATSVAIAPTTADVTARLIGLLLPA